MLTLSKSIDLLGWKYSVHDTRDEYCTEIFLRPKIYSNSVDEFLKKIDAELSKFSDILLLGHRLSEISTTFVGNTRKFTQRDEISNSKTTPRIGVIGSRSKWQEFEKQ